MGFAEPGALAPRISRFASGGFPRNHGFGRTAVNPCRARRESRTFSAILESHHGEVIMNARGRPDEKVHESL